MKVLTNPARFVLLVGLVVSTHGATAGDHPGRVTISGACRTWHKITLTLVGPYAREMDGDPNPFTDLRMTVTFTNASGSPRHAASCSGVQSSSGVRAMARALQRVPFREATVTHEVALETRNVHLRHRDPADRFLVATAQVFDLKLVTADERLIDLKAVPTLANR